MCLCMRVCVSVCVLSIDMYIQYECIFMCVQSFYLQIFSVCKLTHTKPTQTHRQFMRVCVLCVLCVIKQTTPPCAVLASSYLPFLHSKFFCSINWKVLNKFHFSLTGRLILYWLLPPNHLTAGGGVMGDWMVTGLLGVYNRIVSRGCWWSGPGVATTTLLLSTRRRRRCSTTAQHKGVNV